VMYAIVNHHCVVYTINAGANPPFLGASRALKSSPSMNR